MVFFFFNDTATTEIYTLSLHDALPICRRQRQTRKDHYRACRARHPTPALWEGAPHLQEVPRARREQRGPGGRPRADSRIPAVDRKSTRLNSSHANISYAVFCLKKKKPT